jgi:Rap guanine nucleotide exchange factor 4
MIIFQDIRTTVEKYAPKIMLMCDYPFQIPSGKLARASYVVRTILLTKYPNMIRDRKFHLRTYRRCMIGTEMVDWLLTFQNVHSRQQAVGMWQALLEEGVVVHGE